MISYLVDGVLLVALLATSWRVTAVYRELRRLRAFQAQYQGALDASVAALEKVRMAVEAIHAEADAKLAEIRTLVPASGTLPPQVAPGSPEASDLLAFPDTRLLKVARHVA